MSGRPLCLLILLTVTGCEQLTGGGDAKTSTTPENEAFQPAVAAASDPPRAPVTPTPAPEPAPTGRLEELLARLASPDKRTRQTACVEMASIAEGRERAASALAEIAGADPESSVQIAAVRGLEAMDHAPGRAALASVVLAADVADAGWKRAVPTLRKQLRDDHEMLLETFAARLRRVPESGVVLADAVRGLEPAAPSIEFLVTIVRGPHDDSARQAARVLLEYRDAAADHYREAVARVMPSLRGHAERRTFAFEVARPQLPACIEALAVYMAESDDVEDWLAVLDVLKEGVPDHRQNALPQMRTVALRDTTTRPVRDRIRDLLRGPYADQLVVTLDDRRFTYAPLLTTADLLEWEVFLHKSKRSHGAIWLSPEPMEFKIAPVPTKLDFFMLDADGVVLEVVPGVHGRVVRSPATTSFVLVLEGGWATRLGTAIGDRVEFDRSLLLALEEF